MRRRGSEQSSISHPELRPPHLPTQHRELVPKDEQFHVLHIWATPTANQETEHGPHCEIQQREAHPAILAAASPKPP